MSKFEKCKIHQIEDFFNSIFSVKLPLENTFGFCQMRLKIGQNITMFIKLDNFARPMIRVSLCFSAVA